MYNSIMFHCEFYDILQNCCRLSPHVSILVSGVVVQPLHKQNFHFKHRHRRNVTSHHFTSFLFTYFHFYVYSNFFGSYQLKDKYNTQAHIQQLNIFHHFSSLLTPTSIINWKANTVHKNILTRLYKKFNSSYIFVTHPDKFDILWNQGYTKSLIKLLYFWQTSLQIWDTLKPRLYKKLNQVCISWKFGHQVAPLALVGNLATRWRHL